jgi:hypothetical protein
VPSLFHTRFRRALVVLAAATLLIAISVPVGAAGPPGNNGTVKIHDRSTGEEPSPEIQNEPHVGCFHAHFFFADTEQSGDWWIVGQAPTKDNVGTNGSYNTGAGTTYVTADIGLAPGHYKLYWQGNNHGVPDKNIKHKTFWVDGDCGEVPPPNPCEPYPACLPEG